MESFWASSREKKEEIIERLISYFNYENRSIDLQTGINIPKKIAGTLVDTVGVELSDENPRVTISYGQSTVAMAPLPWALTLGFHEIAHLPLAKNIFVGTRVGFTALTSLTSPINIQTPYTYMTYEELLGEFKNLKSENNYFREQLSAINTPQKLQKYSVCCGFLALFSLALTKFFDVDLIHPILAYFVFGISAFFYLLGILMEKKVGK